MIDSNVSELDVAEAVLTEIQNEGRDLGYRAMWKKVREKYNLKVSQNLVLRTMRVFDPEGLARRGNVGQKKVVRRAKQFISPVSFNLFFFHLYL